MPSTMPSSTLTLDTQRIYLGAHDMRSPVFSPLPTPVACGAPKAVDPNVPAGAASSMQARQHVRTQVAAKHAHAQVCPDPRVFSGWRWAGRRSTLG